MKNRFQKYLSLTVALLIMACMFSCRKPQPQGSSVDGGFKSFFDYQVGSYWIFYDSVAKQYDSLYVIEYNDQAANSGVNVDELVSIAMYEDYFDSITGNQWDINLEAGPSGATMFIGPDNEYQYVLAYKYPFQIGTVSNLNTIFSSYTTTNHPSVAIGGTNYNNVYEITFAYNSSGAGDTIYMNAAQGFLSVLLHNQYSHKRLFLKRSHIIQ